MKFLLAALAIASASAAEEKFVCDETCAATFYTHLVNFDFAKHKLTEVDAGVYGYIIYTNYAESGGKNIDLANDFFDGVGKFCGLTDDWVRDEVSDCFSKAECDGDNGTEAAKTAFKDCDAANNDGCSRIEGLLVNQFGAKDCWKTAFPSELSEADKINGAKVFTVFMAVMGNWETMGTDCQGKITTAAGYKAGDDVVLTIADNADKIIEGAKVPECGYKDGKWDIENADAALKAVAVAGDKLTKDVTKAQADVAKLDTKIKADAATDKASSAAVLSAAVAALAMLL